MYSAFFLLTGIAMLLIQLVLCFFCRSWFRFLTVLFFGIGEILLWGSLFLLRPGFFTYYAAIVGAVCLGAVGLAWAFWGIIQLIQKRK